MRFFNLASFKGQLNLIFTLLLTFNIFRFGIVIFSTTDFRTYTEELRVLNNIKNYLKDIETEFENGKLSLMHLIQGFSQEDRYALHARFKRSILNMNDLQQSIASSFDSLKYLDSRLMTDSLAMAIAAFERQGDRIFAQANVDSLTTEERKELYETYLSKIEDDIEPTLLKLLYFNIGKIYVDDRRLVILSRQSDMINASGTVNGMIFFITTLLIIVFWYVLTRRVNMSVGKIYNKLRNILTGRLAKDDSPLLNNELRVLDKLAEQVTEKLIQTVAFVNALGKGKYDVHLDKFNDEDRFTQSLLQMRDALQELAVRDSKRNWINETTAKFAELLRDNSKTTATISRDFLRLIVREVNAQIGGVYLVQAADTGTTQLVLFAAYAYGRDKHLNQTVEPGEGLCGQCYLEEETIVVKNKLHQFFKIPAGIGEIEPTTAAYIPIKLNTKVLGVLEIASVKPFEEHQVELMEKVCVLFAATIESIRSLETNTRLLEQSQMLAEDLRSREEEMRQNMEELAATQEEMLRTQTELFQKFDELERAKTEAEAKLESERIRLQKIIDEKQHIIDEKQHIIRELTAKSHS